MAPPRKFSKKRRRDGGFATEASMNNTESDWWEELSHKLSTTGQAFADNEEGEEEKFKSFFRVSRKTFDYICTLVGSDLAARSSSSGIIDAEGRVVTIGKQVAIALRRLASGESQLSVGESFDVGQSTVSQVSWKFVEAMEDRGMHHLKWTHETQMEEIKVKFEKIQGLPNCCGAIDTTHIVMSLPSGEASNIWHDSEANYSMIMQAIVDPELRFLDILTGWPGSMNDYGILKTSGFFKLCKNGQRLNGPVKDLQDGSQIREYIVGDEAYPLLPWLLTPYQGKNLSPMKKKFNVMHKNTKLVAERALARFKGTWKIIDGVMWRPDKHKLPRIILVCCILHNIIIDQGDELHTDVPLSHHHDEGYNQQFCQFADRNAQMLRDHLSKSLS
ncbi:hypothetical protein SUGI_0039010 [Cryptomeria japonica]|uniref:protein ANTAGONIST OF LIKE HETEROCHROMATIN PROTEIN 1 n=1 Tax=Cryptomeria japonica TaxID=3369 RepID=UPI002408B869|nr:protein ANTAGONIST OF LIKE HETEROCHROMATIN PROTEIN 1 [Cryptomeria japonica]XP_059073405.1 protein ANTAGONIST OF LIKE HETEROCHROMATIN PROTEIN 1 [Cryptomeria japonica]GLJ06427.1 hypothetical protein SUGI_0039010 [Cryptomeria japonica]